MKKIVLLQLSWSQVCSNNINCIILIRNSRDKNILFLLLQRKRKRGKNIDNRQESLTDNARSHQNWYNICHKVGFVMYTIIVENICLKQYLQLNKGHDLPTQPHITNGDSFNYCCCMLHLDTYIQWFGCCIKLFSGKVEIFHLKSTVFIQITTTTYMSSGKLSWHVFAVTIIKHHYFSLIIAIMNLANNKKAHYFCFMLRLIDF